MVEQVSHDTTRAFINEFLKKTKRSKKEHAQKCECGVEAVERYLRGESVLRNGYDLNRLLQGAEMPFPARKTLVESLYPGLTVRETSISANMRLFELMRSHPEPVRALVLGIEKSAFFSEYGQSARKLVDDLIALELCVDCDDKLVVNFRTNDANEDCILGILLLNHAQESLSKRRTSKDIGTPVFSFLELMSKSKAVKLSELFQRVQADTEMIMAEPEQNGEELVAVSLVSCAVFEGV